ncbi:phosphatase PAP2 family protein [Paucibacter sp. R3-3]|uniref:Phosphatase PAP2 family protein n=1 Tax=Roseateles agri TaxID=3098619 RepID=A0ABU5DI12_9BURK|nr:phosphatase PAP2 family protein [Paucibacter sp. R3-3]MDY0744762.1 phosphatase PAP2 family protein [Paucibacter sp. R3-3]
MSMSWHLFTRLGEAQILLPLDLVAMAWLWLGAKRGGLALRWLACMGTAATLTTITKLAFIGWGVGSAEWDFTGISGHAMFASASFPMLAWVSMMNRSEATQRAGIVTAFVLAAAIAYSRLPVHAHSPSEALAGFLVGCVASVMSLRGLTGSHPAVLPLWLPTALAAALLALPASAPAPRTHEWVTRLSLELSGRDRPYVRNDLHRRVRVTSPEPLSAM